jgi:hypothetical protein
LTGRGVFQEISDCESLCCVGGACVASDASPDAPVDALQDTLTDPAADAAGEDGGNGGDSGCGCAVAR